MMNAKLPHLLLNNLGIAFDPSAGETYQLSASGLALVRLLQEGGDEEKLLGHLLAEYDVEEPRARRDVEAFLAQLEEMKWI